MYHTTSADVPLFCAGAISINEIQMKLALIQVFILAFLHLKISYNLIFMIWFQPTLTQLRPPNFQKRYKEYISDETTIVVILNRRVQRLFFLLLFSCYRYCTVEFGMLTLSNEPRTRIDMTNIFSTKKSCLFRIIICVFWFWSMC